MGVHEILGIGREDGREGKVRAERVSGSKARHSTAILSLDEN
jgi:hypothetical protein